MGEEGELVFVYGTLREGASNHFRMEGAEFVGTGWARGRLYAIDWYPGMVLDEEGGRVVGELYRVTKRQLALLDQFEACGPDDSEPLEFRRRRIEVYQDAGAVPAWGWEFCGAVEGADRIESGDWLSSG